MPNFLIIFPFLLSFFSAYFLVPYLKKWHENKRRLLYDQNKFHKKRLKSLEGLIIILIFIISVSLTITLQTIFKSEGVSVALIFSSLISITVIAFLGFADDIMNYKIKYVRLIISLIASLPMIFTSSYYVKSFYLPLIGRVEAPFIYSFFLVPALLIISCLSINYTKSFNKLTLSCGMISVLTLFLACWLKQNLSGMLFFASGLGIFLVLNDFHHHQEKISLGKIGRMSIGAIFATGAIIGEVKLTLAFLLIPFIAYFFLRQIINFLEGKKISIGQSKIAFFGKEITWKRVNRFLALLEVVCAIFALTIQVYR